MLEYDYDAILQEAQQKIDRDRGHAAELIEGADKMQHLVDALRACRKEKEQSDSQWAAKCDRLELENKLLREERELEHKRPLISGPVGTVVKGNQNIYNGNSLSYAKSDAV